MTATLQGIAVYFRPHVSNIPPGVTRTRAVETVQGKEDRDSLQHPDPAGPRRTWRRGGRGSTSVRPCGSSSFARSLGHAGRVCRSSETSGDRSRTVIAFSTIPPRVMRTCNRYLNGKGTDESHQHREASGRRRSRGRERCRGGGLPHSRAGWSRASSSWSCSRWGGGPPPAAGVEQPALSSRR